MASLFADSFDHYATADITTKWTRLAGSPTISAVGRRSTNGLRLNSTGETVHVSVTSSTTVIVGFALTISSLGNFISLFEMMDAANAHVVLLVNADGSLTVYRGNGTGDWAGLSSAPSTALGSTASGIIQESVTAYVELKATISDSVGVITLKVNGVTKLSLTSQDTRNGGTAAVTQIGFGGRGSTNVDIDDLYVLDTTGSVNNDFLGDIRVTSHFMTAEGNSSGFTPSTGTDNAALIDETAPNGDTDYVSATAAGTKDTYAHSAAPLSTTVLALQHNIYCKKSDAGSATIRPLIRHSGTDYNGATQAPGTSYTYIREMVDVNPGTSAQFTETGFNNAEFGFEKVA